MFQLPAYVETLRKEARLLRIYTSQLKRANCSQKDKVKTLEDVVKDQKKRIHELERENNKLKQEIEKISKTNNRYQVAIFDHGNFKQPDGQDKKPKGGQPGHCDTNRESHEDSSSYVKQRLFAKACGKCGKKLARVNATKQKILLDIIIHTEMVKLLLESERQWCKHCHKEVNTRDTRALPFTEYGINTFMMVMVLRFKCHASFSNIATVITISHGLTLSRSDVSSLLKQASRYLGKQYEKLKIAIRKGTVMYADETGWLVHGQKAWMWIMANDRQTVYIAAESRGKGIAEEMYGNSKAYTMTDGLASYTNVIPVNRHLYCWSHALRFAFEETINLPKEHPACRMRDRLVLLYQMVRLRREWTKEYREAVLREEIDSLLVINSDDQTVKNIQYRIRTQKEGLILALLITIDGTNNLSERELRNMAIKRSISNGSNTYQGMQTSAIIGSVIQTLHRTKELPFFPTLQLYLQEGIREKHTQYVHSSDYDDY